MSAQYHITNELSHISIDGQFCKQCNNYINKNLVTKKFYCRCTKYCSEVSEEIRIIRNKFAEEDKEDDGTNSD